MTIENVTPLERALSSTVETELSLMQAFCQDSYPCDVATVVAMRMSRSVVSAICRVRLPEDESGVLLVSKPTCVMLEKALESLEDLNSHFERRLSALPPEAPEKQAWSA